MSESRLCQIYARDLLRFFHRDKVEQSRRVSRHLNSAVIGGLEGQLSRHVLDEFSITFYDLSSLESSVGKVKLDGVPRRKISPRLEFPSRCCQELKVKELSSQLAWEPLILSLPNDAVVGISVKFPDGKYISWHSYVENRLVDVEIAFNCLHFLSHIAECTLKTLDLGIHSTMSYSCLSPLLNPVLVQCLHDWRGVNRGLFRCWKLELPKVEVLFDSDVIQEGIFRDGAIQILRRMGIWDGVDEAEYFLGLLSVAEKFCRELYVMTEARPANDMVDRLIEFFKNSGADSGRRLLRKVKLVVIHSGDKWPKSLPPIGESIEAKRPVPSTYPGDCFQLPDKDGNPFTVIVGTFNREGKVDINSIRILL